MNHMKTIMRTFQATITNSKIASRLRLMRSVAIVALVLAGAATTQAQVSLTWTNTTGDSWESTTAWQTNIVTSYTNFISGSVTSPVPATACQALIPPGALGMFDPCAPGGSGGFPGGQDSATFSNDTSYTITVPSDPGTLSSVTFTQHVGAVSFNMGSQTLTVTNRFRVGVGDATSTVFVVGGTLSVLGDASTSQLRIGDGSNAVGKVVVNNGTLMIDSCALGLSSNSVGSLIISNNGVFRNDPYPDGLNPSTLTCGTSASANSQLIVTNGGKLFVVGTITVGASPTTSNNFMAITGPSSAATITGAGDLAFRGSAGQLLVSNGAKLFMAGSLLFGGNSSYNTGIVVGAGSQVIVGGSGQVGLNSTAATNNFFIVQDGGYISVNGTFAYGNNVNNINNGVQIGGSGAMSTGIFTAVRSSSSSTNHALNFMTVTNAFVSCWYLNPQGPQETVSILSKGTMLVTNCIAVGTPNGNSNAVSYGGIDGAIIVNGGTLSDLLRADNLGGISYGGAGDNVLIVTNGGKLLTSMGTLGAGSADNAATITGSGSVWSNFFGQAQNANFTNFLIVGTGTPGSTNTFGVFNGASLYNAGTFSIGNNGFTAVVNTVTFGGPGNVVTVKNDGSLNVGQGNGSYSNSLYVTNASLTASIINVGNSGATNNYMEFDGGTIAVGYIRIRPTNSLVFSAGTLSVGGMSHDSLANWTSDSVTNPLVVGNGGLIPAYYDMTPSNGTNDFHDGGLVITNNAYLRGSGIIQGNVTVLGTFSPGLPSAAIGSIVTSNNLTFGSSASLNFDLGTAQDSVQVFGNLVLGGTLNVVSNAGFTANTYTLFTYTNNTVSGTITTAGGTLPTGYTYAVSTNTVTLVQLIVSSVAPPVDPWGNWETHYFPGGGPSAAGTADPDGDGVSNTNEFMAGFNPTNPTAYPHVISVAKSGGNMNVTYLGANGDNTWSPGYTSRTNILEFTTGSATGNYSNNFATAYTSTGNGTNILINGTGVGTITTVVDTGGATGTARYYRIRVIAP